jgi:phage FluMu protein gp41
MNITNFGTLGTFNLTIRDDILRSSSNTSMDVTISNVRLIDNGNQIYGTDRQTGVVTIQQQVTSIDRLEGFSVNVFPNPTHHDLNVEVKDATIDQIQVMTVTGQVVQTLENLNSPTVRIALGELPAGVYNLSVRTDKGQRNQMVIKAD